MAEDGIHTLNRQVITEDTRVLNETALAHEHYKVIGDVCVLN